MSGNTSSTTAINARKLGPLLAVLGAAGWFWAVALLAVREHVPAFYQVGGTAPRCWGFFALSNLGLLVIAIVAGLLCAGAWHNTTKSPSSTPTATRWLLLAWIVPLLDFLRLLAGDPLPSLLMPSFFEPLLMCAVTGSAAAAILQGISLGGRGKNSIPNFIWLAFVWLLAIAFGVWWFVQGKQAYSEFMLGFHDFGHFGHRVVNTWEGRGFLLQTPSLPPFWDHFNPGLALLAPLWGLWPDPQLFILVQAVCLALPAPLVFGIARAHGATRIAAAMWGAAYLMFPSLGLMNLNFSYGWHPVSCALPFIFAAIWALSRGWPITAAAAAVVACSFREDVIVILGCLAAAMAIQAWIVSRDRDRNQNSSHVALHCHRLSPRTWLILWILLIVAFGFVYFFSGFAREQRGRILYNSSLEYIFKISSVYFLLALAVPLGLRPLARAWPILLALILPLAVLLVWSAPHATSIAFQYTTTMLPVLFLAAIAGSTAIDIKGASTAQRDSILTSHASYALSACLIGSVFFGALPFTSQPTASLLMVLTYRDPAAQARRQPGLALRSLDRAVMMANQKDASVVATGRIAAHLLGVRRLEPVDEAHHRWEALRAEAGEGRSPIEIFDWVVLDRFEEFQQSLEHTKRIEEAAVKAGYHMVYRSNGVVVYQRPPAEPKAGSQ